MKYRISSLVLVLSLISTALSAQSVTNNSRLSELRSFYSDRYEKRSGEVITYLSNKGIEKRRITEDGGILEIQYIEEGRPVFYETQNSNAAISIKTSELWSGGSLGLSLDGSGFAGLGLWDGGGVLIRHSEFTNAGKSRVSQVDRPLFISDHSTHVAGTMVAGGVNPLAKGMAFNGTLRAWDWNNDESEMAGAALDGIVVSNHSYGAVHGWSGDTWYGDPNVSVLEDYWFGFYSESSREWDEIAYNAPYYLIVKSVGNDRDDIGDGTYPPDGNQGSGFDCVGTKSCAKNILTVGSVEDILEYSGPESVIISDFSSWGPVDDGRIKPDIVSNGSSLFSSLGSEKTAYGVYDGTSMAAASTSGTLALLQEHYQNTHEGNNMRAATLKALIINTADEAGLYPGPDYKHGWGLLNARRAAEKIGEDDNPLNLIDEQVLTNGSQYSREVYCDGTQALKVTIVWTDPFGIPVSPSLDPDDVMLVNDLDLRIEGNNTTYFPWKLDKNNPELGASNNSENNVDNVETVFVASPVEGLYTLTVDHDGILAGEQYFAIVISGIAASSSSYCESAGNAVEEWIESITFGDNPAVVSGSTGSSGYKDFSDVIFSVETFGQYALTMEPGFSGRSTFEYWAVWIDLNYDMDFSPDERLFASGKSKTTESTTIVIPDIPPGETRMRIAMSRDGIPEACGGFAFGEVEDYTINITGYTPPTDYCLAGGLEYSLEWIENVSITGLIDNSSAGDGYSIYDYTNVTLEEGQEYNLSLSPGFPKKIERENWRVWIDYNGDYIFSQDEEIFSAGSARGNVGGVFTVPQVPVIQTRMRVAMSRSTTPGDCGDIEFGEVEDYQISLNGSLVPGQKAGRIEAELNSLILNVYPNPVHDKLNISVKGNKEKARLTIFSINGESLLYKNFVQEEVSVSTAQLPPGVYLLKVETAAGPKFRKIIKN